MVRTVAAKAEAARQPELTLVASSGPWDIYLVDGSDIVVPLDTQPVVVQGRGGDARERYLELGTSWFQHRDEWSAMPADDGPAHWQRVAVTPDLSRRDGESGDPGRRVDIVIPTEPIASVPLPAVAVSNVVMGQDSVAFDVDQVGVPVLVKVGYFPNWNASGAEGPYRVGPNMMVVVPTAAHVELHYGRSAVDYLTMLLTLVGIALCVFWRKVGDVAHVADTPGGFPPLHDGRRPYDEHHDERHDDRAAHSMIEAWSSHPDEIWRRVDDPLDAAGADPADLSEAAAEQGRWGAPYDYDDDLTEN
jgi:hypothetical protein